MPKFTATEEDVAQMVGATSNEDWWIIAVVQCVVDYCAALQLLAFFFDHNPSPINISSSVM